MEIHQILLRFNQFLLDPRASHQNEPYRTKSRHPKKSCPKRLVRSILCCCPSLFMRLSRGGGGAFDNNDSSRRLISSIQKPYKTQRKNETLQNHQFTLRVRSLVSPSIKIESINHRNRMATTLLWKSTCHFDFDSIFRRLLVASSNSENDKVSMLGKSVMFCGVSSRLSSAAGAMARVVESINRKG